jgi:hypothetical protein
MAELAAWYAEQEPCNNKRGMWVQGNKYLRAREWRKQQKE